MIRCVCGAVQMLKYSPKGAAQIAFGGRFHGTYPPNYNEGTHPVTSGPDSFLS